MTRSTNMEHVEVLRHMKETIKAIMPSEVAALDAAIAALSAPQPPAEAQPVAWEWEYVGFDPYPRWQTVARALHEMDPQNPPYPETWRPTRPLVYGDAAPQQPEPKPEARGARIARRRDVRLWMRHNAGFYDTATELAEAADDVFRLPDGALDNETHWVWDEAVDAINDAQREERS